MKNEYCVYVHINKVNGKRYVGITRRQPKDRWHGGSNYKQNPHFYRAIKKYGWDGFDHVVLFSGLTRDEAVSWEIALISQWNLTNPKNGYNVSNGGDGAFSISDRMRSSMSKAAKKRFEDPEEIEKNRERGRKRFSTAEAIERDRQSQLKFHEEHPDAKYLKARAVNQYLLDGRFIRSWRSITDARSEYPGTGIQRACQNKYGSKSAAGFMWRYADEVCGDSDIDPVCIDTCQRKINQYSLDGKYIQSWNGISEAEKTLNIKNLSEVCNGRRGKSAGYMWRFADLEDRKQIEPYRRGCRAV